MEKMCGIVGIYNKNLSMVDRDVLLNMNNSIVHRGPDDSGCFVDRYVGIAMRRLSIIDLQSGHQPIFNEDNTIAMVFNGEIYNYVELKKDLGKRHLFKTNTDTEVILHLYEEKGIECLQYLRGMFAIAIWDMRDETFFLVRDRLGIKPIYYFENHDRLIFASEIKAILKSGYVSGRINYDGLDHYFTLGYFPLYHSYYRDIKKILPGHYLKIKNKKTIINKYWSFSFIDDKTKTEEDFADEFISIFEESVKIRMRSDVPLGAFLSGGIDSSLVVAMMARNASKPINTFSMGFTGDIGGYDDERKYARIVSEMYDTNHTELESAPDFEIIEKDLRLAFDEPFADDSIIPSYYICKNAVEYVKVALTGLGGDELFAGYERYLGLYYDNLFSLIPVFIRKFVIVPIINRLPELKNGNYTVNHIKRFVRNSVNPADEKYLGYISMLTQEFKKRLYLSDFYSKVDFEKNEAELLEFYSGSNVIDKAAYFDLNIYVPDDLLVLTDRLSMLNSLELRVPFLDHKLVEFCATIPSSMRLRKGIKKYLLKKIAKKYVPKEIVEHKKQGFAAPMTMWLKTDLRKRALSLKHNDKVGKFLNLSEVGRIIDLHMAEREIYDRFIFSMFMLGWH